MGESGSAGRELDVMVDQAVQQGILDEQFLQLRSLQVRGCVWIGFTMCMDCVLIGWVVFGIAPGILTMD